MARSSGGGSRSGGSRSGGSRSSSRRSLGGRGSGIITSNKYFTGARKFRYYRNGEPHYVYSNSDLSRMPDIKPRWLLLLFYLPFLVAIISFWCDAVVFPMEPMQRSESGLVRIIDEADVFDPDEEGWLVHALTEFSETTGVVTQIVTVDWDEWQKTSSSFSSYALSRYYVQFQDENCWLLIYSELDGGCLDWEWEGIQGDHTIDVMDVFIDSFNRDVQAGLIANHEPDVAGAFEFALRSATDRFQNQSVSVDKETLLAAVFTTLFIGFHSYVMVFAGTHKKYSNKELEEVFF